MKQNSVVTNMPQDFTEAEKRQGRENIDAICSADLSAYATQNWTENKIYEMTSGLAPDYEAGQYVLIENDTISVTGLQPSGNYQPAGDYLTSADLVGYATESYVDSAVSGKQDLLSYTYNQNNEIIAIDDHPIAIGSGGSAQYTGGRFIEIAGSIISVSGDYELIPGNGISIEDNGSGYVISCSASGGSGSTYTAGDYVSIVNDTISVTGLQPSGDYQPAGDYAQSSALASKLDTSAYHEYSGVNNIGIEDYMVSVTGTKQVVAGPGISIATTTSSYIFSSDAGSLKYSSVLGGLDLSTASAVVGVNRMLTPVTMTYYTMDITNESGSNGSFGMVPASTSPGWLYHYGNGAIAPRSFKEGGVKVIDMTSGTPSASFYPHGEGYTEVHITTPFTGLPIEYCANIDGQDVIMPGEAWYELVWQAGESGTEWNMKDSGEFWPYRG